MADLLVMHSQLNVVFREEEEGNVEGANMAVGNQQVASGAVGHNPFLDVRYILMSCLLGLSWSLLEPIVFRGPQNFEPSNGICPLLRNFKISMEFRGICKMTGD